MNHLESQGGETIPEPMYSHQSIEDAAHMLRSVLDYEDVVGSPRPEDILHDPKIITFGDFQRLAQGFSPLGISNAWESAVHCLMQDDIGDNLTGLSMPNGRGVQYGDTVQCPAIMFNDGQNPYEVGEPKDIKKAIRNVSINARVMEFIASSEPLTRAFTELRGSASQHSLNVWRRVYEVLPEAPSLTDQPMTSPQIIRLNAREQTGEATLSPAKIAQLLKVLESAGIQVDLQPLSEAKEIDRGLRRLDSIIGSPPNFIDFDYFKRLHMFNNGSTNPGTAAPTHLWCGMVSLMHVNPRYSNGEVLYPPKVLQNKAGESLEIVRAPSGFDYSFRMPARRGEVVPALSFDVPAGQRPSEIVYSMERREQVMKRTEFDKEHARLNARAVEILFTWLGGVEASTKHYKEKFVMQWYKIARQLP